MNPPRRVTITDENKEESRRLKVIWLKEKAVRKFSQDAFGAEFKIGSQAAVGFFLSGQSAISMKAAKGFAAGLNCSIADFSPRLAKEAAEAGALALPDAESQYRNTSDIFTKLPLGDPSDVVIPQYKVGGAMGNGLILEEKQPGIIKSWSVDRDWLHLNVRHHTGVKNLCIVTGFGSSMRPKYNPGDPLLLDRGVTSVETEGIFFFRVGNHGFIKQLQRIPTEDGMIIRAKSLNKDYDPFDITAKMDFAVFGKVLTVWRSEQV